MIFIFKMKKYLSIILFSCLCFVRCFSQEVEKKNTKQDTATVDKIIKATEFSIPTSGAFTLLGNNPANVATPGFTKDIKVDYFLDEFSLKPNIAFEFQPIWLFGFKNVSFSKYKEVNPIVRFLSTANVSIGTFTKEEVSKLAYSIKFSFYKEPMKDTAYTNNIDRILEKVYKLRIKDEQVLSKRKAQLRNQIQHYKTNILALSDLNVNYKRDLDLLAASRIKNDDAINKLNVLLQSNITEILKLGTAIIADSSENARLTSKLEAGDPGYNQLLKDELIAFSKKYKEQNWGKPRLDIGAGKVDTYQNASVTQLGLKSNGYGLWANPSIGFAAGISTDQREAAKILLTGLFKYVESEGIGQNFYGGNIRYGSSTLNLFAEYTYLKEGSDVTNSLAYGGSYTIGSKKLIEFGIRTDYTKDFSFKSLIPVVAFNWKLGQDLFK